MVIFGRYFVEELIAVSYKKQQRCERRIRKNHQITNTEHDVS